MSGSGIERVIFDVTRTLLVPVLVLALLALALVLVETGKLAVELTRRRGRHLTRLQAAAEATRAAAGGSAARQALRPVMGSARMAAAAERLLTLGADEAGTAKVLADFDYASLRALERTRILVRFGPALGLVGTLLPLSPALAALSRGNVADLAQDLRVAFSVTVLGLLVGAIAFGISLVRDRLYAQDLSDLEYLAALLEGAPAPVVATAAWARE